MAFTLFSPPGWQSPRSQGADEQERAMDRDPHRHLASDARAGTFARRKARQDQRTYVRRNWHWLLGGYVTLTSLLILPALFDHRPFVRGLVVGLALAGVAGLLVAMIIIQTGTGPTMAGELAEQWTAQELRPLTKQGYRLANHVNVDGRGDADHVLVGPAGLFVIETKWSASEWKVEDRFFAAPLEQARARARNTWLQVKRHGIADATPVLVLWGRAAKELSAGPGARRNGNTYVVAGLHLRRWLLTRPEDVLAEEQINATYAAVCALAERGDKVEAPVPPSVGRLYMQAVGAFSLAVVAFVSPIFMARLGPAAYLATAGAVLGVGVLAIRRDRRIAGFASAIGSGAALIAGAVVYAVTLSRI